MMGTTIVHRVTVASALAVLAAAACGKGFDPSVFPTPDSLYQAAVAHYEAGDCGKADDGFRQLILDLPPRDPRIVDARFFLADCLRQDGQQLEAAREFRRVADEFPQHPRAPDALLGAAEANASLWKRPELDPTYGETAQAIFRELLARYPNTPAAQRASAGLAALNEKFAHKTFKAGDFYLRLRAYDSAIIYFRDVVANYPRSTLAPRALLKLLEAYEKIGYVEERLETCAHLRQFYPQAPDLDKACPAPATSP
jgi:outer membrane protein assembly factor BamD